MVSRAQNTPSSGKTVRLRDGREVIVRPIQWGDEHALCRFYDKLSRQSRAWFRPEAFTLSSARAVILQAQSGDEGTWLVAETRTALLRRRRIVGYAWVCRLRGDPIPFVGLAVADDYQGQGLGRTMLTHLIDQARKAGEKQLQLNVYKDNARAIRLYEKTGFVMNGETDDRKQFRMLLHLDGTQGG